MKSHWLLVVGICALAGCTQSTPVSLINRSNVALENMVISGSGFEQSIGTVAPGATATAHVSPVGESGLGLSFRAGARSIVLPPQGYFEGGGDYRVVVSVEPDLSATVNGSTRY